jgi:hypothetical protein
MVSLEIVAAIGIPWHCCPAGAPARVKARIGCEMVSIEFSRRK